MKIKRVLKEELESGDCISNEEVEMLVHIAELYAGHRDGEVSDKDLDEWEKKCIDALYDGYHKLLEHQGAV